MSDTEKIGKNLQTIKKLKKTKNVKNLFKPLEIDLEHRDLLSKESVVRPNFSLSVYKEVGAIGEINESDNYVKEHKEDITQYIRDNILSLSFEDKDGEQSDEITLSMNGLYDRILGTKLSLSLGTEENQYDYGIFFVNSVSIDYKDQKTDIKATSIDFSSQVKINKKRSWHNITLKSLAKQIAHDNSLKLYVSVGVADLALGTITQNNVNDLEFLYKVADKYGYVMSVKDDTINILYKKLAMADNPVHTINVSECTSLNIDKTHRTEYGSATLTWHVNSRGKTAKATFGTAEPCYYFEGHIPKNEEEGKRIAEGELMRVNLNELTGSLTTPIIKEVRAGNTLHLKGTYGDDGQYYIESVSHNLSPSGYSMSVNFKGKINEE